MFQLVGMQTGETTVENSMDFPQKTKNGTAVGFDVTSSLGGKLDLSLSSVFLLFRL